MKKTILSVLDQIFRDVTAFGSFVFIGFLLVLTTALQQWNLALDIAAGIVFTFAVVLLVRIFYFKDRPAKQGYSNFIEKIDASSFPSLHTARIIFLALLFIYVFNSLLTTVVLVLTTAIVSYSRIHLKKHDWKDVVGGIILGLITYWLTTFVSVL